ncbi:zinc-dependent alcohol dehydrogenase family protein [Oryzomonas japonica]|uniref:Zinc-dependent alcohol dehydrogenase family protein n=1 Tax=Oryzomonas japonica TaxID=2603858 RepID=A0A7J4ZN09_9BACT|nr:zinc-dependent alcohol dehydrogenase family protein [Oryzomonas japonica]KAB0664048.1 zinc-dependent alcohol dehydrogenase family protein [Oryzomonas japonica]
MPKIVRFYETGDAGVLKLEEAPLVEPGAGEIRLKVAAIGLNRAEVMFRQGQYLEAPKLPSRIGYEAAGIVDAVGPGVSGIKVGDRVSTIPSFSVGDYGVYGESAIVPAYAAVPYPGVLTPVEGAAIWMQYLTAFGALVEFGRLQKGESVVITAASSSVGLAAIQVAKYVGATAIAATRGAGKKDFLLGAGADHVIVTDEEDLVARVMAITAGKGATMVFDPVAGPLLEKLAAAAAQGATIFEYGALSPAPTPFPLFAALGKGLSVRGYTLFEIVREPEMLARGKQFVSSGLESGALKPVIDRTFPLENIVEAHRYMESNLQQGKIVVTV